ncbi:hypothetical protein EDD16DRAFT_1799551 [Pisolithus croceorrhizus]|nr:hypothetical protein EDD16DRAFT_1799551 [Pisolithus croceorrhizus]
MLAVPYCAKDVPAPRAEFGHPDVAIVLTSLSYYCGGLDQEQLMLCFECLLTLDNPDQEYKLWVCDCPEVPENLHQINGVNAQSLDQWDQYLLLMFSHNQSMVDFYLSQVVFLREAKQFHSNLSSCGWDLAEKREQITTVEQEPEIHVILDVGAQVLELKNNEFARHWLEWKPDALGAIYFDEEDELTMLSCDRTTQSLSQSPYASRLDECIVYFDDAHTWGTSIKFLIGFHAAVTLGPKVMKDCLMQGCMCMRKLGCGPSVMFFGPLDVDRNIRDATRKSNRDMIHPSDILLWAMGVMCLEIKNSAPYWAQQGRDHTLWYSAWSKFCSNETTSQELAKTWHQPDAKTLEELYVPSTPKDHWLLSVLEVDERCRKLGVSLSLDLNMNKEQEQEIIHKMECEMQVERPPPATPALHQVSTDVRHFVHMGIVTPHWRAFVLMFNLFCNTITPSKKRMCGPDTSLQPLTTALWCKDEPKPTLPNGNPTLIILSPFEVNKLLPEIRNSSFICLHIYTPQTQARMCPCDDLHLYTIPPTPSDWIAPASLVDQVNLFTGQLYLCDYSTYLHLCCFLCVYANDLAGEADLEVESDGFILPPHCPLKAWSTGSFQKSPLAFLKYVIDQCRRGMNCVVTHMGRVLIG